MSIVRIFVGASCLAAFTSNFCPSWWTIRPIFVLAAFFLTLVSLCSRMSEALQRTLSLVVPNHSKLSCLWIPSGDYSAEFDASPAAKSRETATHFSSSNDEGPAE